uniref:Uncharacterized protein n=1 Tax=Arion vulgaris TaxID=1028688 RepID=A0A0B7BC13_9EUPU
MVACLLTNCSQFKYIQGKHHKYTLCCTYRETESEALNCLIEMGRGLIEDKQTGGVYELEREILSNIT